MDRRRRSGGGDLHGGSDTRSYALISAAIENQERVAASYSGFRREFCPHVLGLREGHYRVVAFQYGGSSQEGAAPAWRCFDLDKLRNISIGAGRWRSGDAAKAPRDCVDAIEAVVDGFDVSDWDAELRTPEAAPEKQSPLGKLNPRDEERAEPS